MELECSRSGCHLEVRGYYNTRLLGEYVYGCRRHRHRLQLPPRSTLSCWGHLTGPISPDLGLVLLVAPDADGRLKRSVGGANGISPQIDRDIPWPSISSFFDLGAAPVEPTSDVYDLLDDVLRGSSLGESMLGRPLEFHEPFNAGLLYVG